MAIPQSIADAMRTTRLRLSDVDRPLAREGGLFLAEFDRLRTKPFTEALIAIAEAQQHTVTAIHSHGGLTPSEQRAVTDFVRLANEMQLTPASRHSGARVAALRDYLAASRSEVSSKASGCDREVQAAELAAQGQEILDVMRWALEQCLVSAYGRGRPAGRVIARDSFLRQMKSAVAELRRDSLKVTRRATAIRLGIDPKTLTRYLEVYRIRFPPD